MTITHTPASATQSPLKFSARFLYVLGTPIQALLLLAMVAAAYLMSGVAKFHVSFWVGLVGLYLVAVLIVVGLILSAHLVKKYGKRRYGLAVSIPTVVLSLVGLLALIGVQAGLPFNFDNLMLGVVDAIIFGIGVSWMPFMLMLSRLTKTTPVASVTEVPTAADAGTE